jgi:hypothetical protein
MLNPMVVAKLNLNAVNNFKFPKITKDKVLESKYGDNDVNLTRSFVQTQLVDQANKNSAFFPKLKEDDNKIYAPPMLIMYCNLAELLRLRELLIL